MSKTDKLIQKLLSGASDANFNFEELKTCSIIWGLKSGEVVEVITFFSRKE